MEPDFASDEPGWAGFRHNVDSRKIELPIHKPVSKFKPLVGAQQEGYTRATLDKLGPLCDNPEVLRTYSSQLEQMGAVQVLDQSGAPVESRVLWTGGCLGIRVERITAPGNWTMARRLSDRGTASRTVRRRRRAFTCRRPR